MFGKKSAWIVEQIYHLLVPLLNRYTIYARPVAIRNKVDRRYQKRTSNHRDIKEQRETLFILCTLSLAAIVFHNKQHIKPLFSFRIFCYYTYTTADRTYNCQYQLVRSSSIHSGRMHCDENHLILFRIYIRHCLCIYFCR